MDDLVLAAFQWDPQIRGFLILAAAIVMLPGSVYLLLATNTGARMGFVLALTGLAGWMTVMGATWMVFGIGLKGREPEWVVKEIVTGPASQSLLEVLDEFPEGWEELRPGDAELAEAQAAADKVLAPASAEEGGGEGGEEEGGAVSEEAERFESPFSRTEDYVLLDGFRRGGEDYFLTLRHRPHYALVRVKPSFFEETPPGLKAQPDLTGPTTTVVMLRDLGNLRFPPFLVMMSSLIIFGVCCWHLHQRDKEIMRLRAAAAT